MKALTERQEEILGYIRSSVRQRGYPPTLRELGLQTGIKSTNGVNDHLRALERKGYITRADLKSRGIRLLDEPAPVPTPQEETRAIPILGRVAAGAPLYAEENLVDTIRVSEDALPGGEIFGLRVHGSSMVDAGILDGDYVFVRRQAQAERGQIVVALIGDSATVKRFYPEKDYVRFQPANASMAPILVRACDFVPTMLLGIVVGSFRRY